MSGSTNGSQPDADVTVVGAGPSGLVAAIRLLQLGLTVTVVDAVDRPVHESRAALMHAATVEILADMGLRDELIARGNRIDTITLADRGRALAKVRFAALDSPYPFALSIPQHETEGVLLAHLERLGQRVIRGVRVDSLVQEGPRYRVSGAHRASGQPWSATSGYVIGADGKDSTVRRETGIEFDGSPYEDAFVLADVELAPPPTEASEARVCFSPLGVTVLGLLPSGRYRVVATAPRGQDVPQEPGRAYLDAMLRDRDIPSATADDPAWASRFRISHHVARRLRAGNILLCGDAAHVHSPAAGQGMNTGVADAYELAQCIAAARAGDVDALDGYERRRTEAAHEVVALTDRITRIALVRTGPARALRDGAITVLGRVPAVRRSLARSVSGLDRRPALDPSGGLAPHAT